MNVKLKIRKEVKLSSSGRRSLNLSSSRRSAPSPVKRPYRATFSSSDNYNDSHSPSSFGEGSSSFYLPDANNKIPYCDDSFIHDNAPALPKMKVASRYNITETTPEMLSVKYQSVLLSLFKELNTRKDTERAKRIYEACSSSSFGFEDLQAVFETCRNYRSVPAIQKVGCQLIALFSCINEQNRKLLLSANALEVGLEALRSSSEEDTELMRLALRALCRLVENDHSVQLAFESLGGVATVLEKMRTHPDATAVQEEGIKILDRLAFGSDVTGRNSYSQESIGKQGGIPLIVAAMANQAFFRSVQIAGCSALRSIALEHTENQHKVRKEGGIKLLLKSMKNHGTSSDVQLVACDALAFLARRNEETQKEVGSSGGLEMVLSSLRMYTNNPSVLQRACWAVGILVHNNASNQVKILKKTPFYPIAEGFRYHEDSPNVLVWLCWVVRQLCNNCNEGQEQCQQAGILAPLVQMLLRYPAEAQLQRQALRALSSLVKRNTANQKALVQAGALPGVMTTMKTNLDYPDILKQGCRFLAYVAFGDTDLQTLVAQSGAIEIITTAMSVNPLHAGLQEVGCLALGNVACQQIDSQKIIMAANGLQIVLESMCQHPESADLQAYGCLVLANLAESNTSTQHEIVERGAVEIIIAAMNNHLESCTVQQYCCLALSHLSTQHSHQDHIATYGAVGAVLNAMIEHLQVSPDVQHFACTTLGNLVDGNSQIQRMVLESNGISTIRSAMQMHQPYAVVQEKGIWAVGALAKGNSKLKGRIAQQMQQLIFSAMTTHRSSLDVQIACFWTLHHLCYENSFVQRLLCSANLPEIVVTAMRQHRTDAQLCKQGCRLLGSLGPSFVSSPSEAANIVSQDAIPCIIKAMLRHMTKQPDLLKQAARALAFIAQNLDSGRTSILQNRGLEVLRTASKMHPDTVKLQDAVRLAEISLCSPRGQIEEHCKVVRDAVTQGPDLLPRIKAANLTVSDLVKVGGEN